MVKSKAEVVQATKQEIQSTWRVYVKEWIYEASDCTPESLEQIFEHRFGGRLQPEDWRIRDVDDEGFEFILEVRLWNVKAEWKYEEEAQEHARLLRACNAHPEAEAIPRNSRREHLLLSYGKLLLKEVKSEETE